MFEISTDGLIWITIAREMCQEIGGSNEETTNTNALLIRGAEQ